MIKMKPDINKLYREIRDRISSEIFINDTDEPAWNIAGYYDHEEMAIYCIWKYAFTQSGIHILLHEYRHHIVFKRFHSADYANRHYWLHPEKHEQDADDYAYREMKKMGFGYLHSWISEHNRVTLRQVKNWQKNIVASGQFNVSENLFPAMERVFEC